MNSQWILNIFFSSKFTSRNLILFLSHVCGETTALPIFCRTSAVVLTFVFASSFASIYIQQNARHIVRPNSIFVQKQNILYKTPSALRILTKYIKFPRLYSFLLFKYFNVFSKCACSPRAVKNSYMSIRHRNSRCV